MSVPADPATELQALKKALWVWANSKTYADGCRNWRGLTELIGFDPATDKPVPHPVNDSEEEK